MNNLKNIFSQIEDKLLIFDLDGTIADTEKYHWMAHDIVLKEYGITLSDDDIKKYIGHNDEQIYSMICEDYSVKIDINTIISNKVKTFKNLAKQYNIRPFPEIDEIISKSNNKKIILTSQRLEIVNMLLRMWNYENVFDEIISLASSKKTKLETVESLRLQNKSIIIFEDTPRIINQMRNNNIECIAVLNNYNNYLIHKDCLYIDTTNKKNGLFVGMTTLDYLYYIEDFPSNNMKIKTTKYKRYVGGPAANAAITYSLLGGKSTLATCLGDSREAIFMKSILNKYHVTVLDFANDKILPNISFISIDKNGKRTIMSGQSKFKDIKKLIIDKPDFCLFDLNQQEISLDILSIIDTEIIIDAGNWKNNAYEFLKKADIIISSEDFKDMNNNSIFNMDLPKNKMIAITRGNKGVQCPDFNILADSNIKCKDSLGAGDIFHGAFCYYFYNQEKDFFNSLSFANKIAQESVKYYGPREWYQHIY